MSRTATVRLLLTLGSGLLLDGCGEDLTAPATGSVEITSITEGDSTDSNGYTATLDGGEPRALGISSVLTFTNLSAGEHQVKLDDIAANCQVQGDNPRTVVVGSEPEARVPFQIACSVPPGSVVLTITTTGENLDQDGYSVTLTGRAAEAVDINSSFTWSGVGSGQRSLLIDGIAPDCTLNGSNPTPLTVGTAPVAVEIEITCAPPSGGIVISTNTAGLKPDPDGYSVQLDDGPPQSVATSGTVTIDKVRVGEHQVKLDAVADNCAVKSPNPATVTVAYRRTTNLAFEIACHADAGAGVLLFSSDKSGESHVYRINADGSGVKDLTPDAEGEGAAWSPDRKQVVFVSDRAGAYALFLMKADGSGVRRLRTGVQPAWSPDGRVIAFVNAGMIMLMNADGSNVRPFDAGASPTWSPDGSRIAFVRVDQSRCFLDFFCPSEIFVKGLDGSEPRRLTASIDPSDRAGSPAWSPDATTIAYSRVCCFLGSHLGGLWQISAAGGESRRITDQAASAPVWAPDGSAIAYAGSKSGGPTDLTVIPSGGGTEAVLWSSKGSEYPSSWR